MSEAVVIVVGRRNGALRAARSLGLGVWLVDDSDRTPKSKAVRRHLQVDLSDVDACADAVRMAKGEARVSAVVAAVERAVLPAARIRETLGLSGMGVEASRPWRDKIAMKERVGAAGLPIASQAAVDADTDSEALVASLGLPMVIKPRSSSGSRGTRIARTEADVADALRGAPPGQLTAEAFVRGRELSVESFVVDGAVKLANVTDYHRPGWANVVPASLSEEVERAVRELNERALEALGIDRGITHLEAFVQLEPELRVVFGEAAARPPGGFIMDLIERAYGFDPWRALLEMALGQTPALPAAAVRSAGVWFLHGGEGAIEAVEGLEEARAVAGVVAVETKLEPGQRVRRRAGVGEHHGRIVASTDDHGSTVTALEEAHACVRIRAS